VYTPSQILVRSEGGVMWDQYYIPPCRSIQIGDSEVVLSIGLTVTITVVGLAPANTYDCDYHSKFEVICNSAYGGPVLGNRVVYIHPNRFVDCTKCMHYDEDDIPF